MATKAPDLATEVASGDRRRALTAIRDKLAADLLLVDSRYVAPLAKQLTDVLSALDALPVEKGSAVDELAKRRASRRKNAQVADGSAPGVVGGSGGD